MQYGSNALSGPRLRTAAPGPDVGIERASSWRTLDWVRLALHVLVIAGYVMANAYGNKLMFGVLVPWFVFEMLQRRRPQDMVSVRFIVGAGILIFGSKALAYLYTGAVPNDVLLRECVMIAANNVLWAAILAMTLDSIRTVWRVLFAYALLRTVESGVGGLLVYFLPERFYSYSYQFLVVSDNLDEESFLLEKADRLFGFCTHDSVNTGVYLAVAISVLFCVIVSRQAGRGLKVLSIPLLIVASSALVFTWSRTGWAAVALFAIAYLYRSGRQIKPVLIVGVIVAGLLYFAKDIVSERMFLDERLAGSESIELRFITQLAYLANFPSFGLFGIGLARTAIPNALALPLDASSEQCVIQAFAETGLVGGSAFVYFLGRSTYSLLTSISICRGDIAYLKETGNVILCLIFVFFLQASTCLMTYNDGMFWFLGGCALAFKAIAGSGPGWIPRRGSGGLSQDHTKIDQSRA